jgi:hypothetical protein
MLETCSASALEISPAVDAAPRCISLDFDGTLVDDRPDAIVVDPTWSRDGLVCVKNAARLPNVASAGFKPLPEAVDYRTRYRRSFGRAMSAGFGRCRMSDTGQASCAHR